VGQASKTRGGTSSEKYNLVDRRAHLFIARRADGCHISGLRLRAARPEIFGANLGSVCRSLTGYTAGNLERAQMSIEDGVGPILASAPKELNS
jgi:hypothetical protein